MWILFGIMSVVFTFMNLHSAVNKSKLFQLSSIAAFSSTVLTVLFEYRMINNWVKHKDWSAVSDVMPTMNTVLTIYAIFIIIVNICSLMVYICEKN